MATPPMRWCPTLRVVAIIVACVLAWLPLTAGRAVAQPYAAAIMDVRTGEFLFTTDNSNARVHPASLTKMMTLYIVFEAIENGEISLDTRVRISRHAAAQPPSRLGLRAGQTIALRYLIRAAALRSANDAATALAEAIEGSVPAFSRRMNRTARAIGMSRTNFVNPHGLTADTHLSTARDMSRLGRQLYFDYREYYSIFSRRSEDAGIATVTNTNSRFLDSYRGADGIKTGYTRAAGYNLTAMAERDGVRLIVTVMGGRSSADRLRRVSDLMDRGFRLAPGRATTRRPARPDYVRGEDDQGSGVAAGRTIRLQTAPTRSRFPRPRPVPGGVPDDAVLAALREGIDGVIDEIREPDAIADTDDPGVAPDETSEEPDEASEAVADLVVAVAPERSPRPLPRPFVPEVAAASVPETPVEAPAETVPVVSAEPPVAPAPETAPVTDTAQVETLEVTVVEPVASDNGLIEIPGLPPIAADGIPVTQHPVIEPPATEGAPETETRAAEVAAPMLEPMVADLSVDDEGRVLWRDEEILSALATENPEDPVLLPVIVLTTSANAAPALPVPMPEIVSRASSSGGQLHRVELGVFSSRFDAERILLRLALSEASTLSAGVRRVAERGGRFIAMVDSLSENDAALACARLAARAQECVVVAP